MKNKLKDSKKATILYYIVIPGFFLALVFFYVSSLDPFDTETKYVGYKELSLIKLSQEANKYFLFTDASTKLSADKSILNLAEKGGFALASPCSNYLNYQLWTAKGKQCFPEYQKEFSSEFNTQINLFLQQLPSEEFVNFAKTDSNSFYPKVQSINYNLFISKDKITGIADKALSFGLFISKPKIGQYNSLPSFNIKNKVNTEEFEKIESEAIALINKCTLDPIDECIAKEKPSNWIVGSCEGDSSHEDRTFRFCVNSNTEITSYSDKSKSEKKKMQYRFALYFPLTDEELIPSETTVIESPLETTDLSSIEQEAAKASEKYSIDKNIILALIQQESNNNPNAIRCEQSYENRWQDLANTLNCQQYNCNEIIQSPQGNFHKVSCSYGLMQLMYPTALETCPEIVTTPESLYTKSINIDCGAKYLSKLIAQCGSISRGIYAYNHGPANCKTADINNDSYVLLINNKCSELGCSLV